jgi:alpha-D-xyloside xylohydrolase
MRFVPALLLLVVTPWLFACPAPKELPNETPPVEEPTPYTPRWAFRPWISKDISTRDDTFAFVQGFADRDIPVGAVVLDSPWASNYNSFIPNPSRYPDFKGMVDTLHERDIKLVVWTTQMINASSFDVESGGDTYEGASPNFAEAKRNNYFVDDGHLNLWWKGQGGAIDFFNPDAVRFWEREQDKMLELGLDGWKLDFGEDYIEHFPIRTADGEKSRQEYSEAYLRNFWRHGWKRSSESAGFRSARSRRSAGADARGELIVLR